MTSSEEPSPQSFVSLAPAAFHVLQVEVGTPAKFQIDADGREPEIFGAQPGVVVPLFRKSIRNLRGDYGAESQSCVRGVSDKPAEYSPLMSAVPTAALRYAGGNDLPRRRMLDNEESVGDGLIQRMLQVVTRKSEVEEVLVCALIVGPGLPDLIGLGDTGYADEAG